MDDEQKIRGAVAVAEFGDVNVILTVPQVKKLLKQIDDLRSEIIELKRLPYDLGFEGYVNELLNDALAKFKAKYNRYPATWVQGGNNTLYLGPVSREERLSVSVHTKSGGNGSG